MAADLKLSELDEVTAIADADTNYLLDADAAGVSKKGTFTKVWTWVKTHLASMDAGIGFDTDRTYDIGADGARAGEYFGETIDIKSQIADTGKGLNVALYAQQDLGTI